MRIRYLEFGGNEIELFDRPNGLEILLEKITRQTREFPGYAIIRRVAWLSEPWTVENEMQTPTLKLRRGKILERYKAEVEKLYEGH